MPSIVSGFEYDIFISYRHNDNRSGWVTEFVNALQEELAATVKDPLSIYFDKNPHDGLLETHNVDKSLEGKLKCLIFIPIISQTYCDTKSFAWQHEFCAFNKLAKEDQFGRDIKLRKGNIASRILPIKIHDLDVEDKFTIENEIEGVLRAIELIYKSAGVNRPLTSSDKKEDNDNKTFYRDQINKIANAVKEIIVAIKNPAQPANAAPKPLLTNPSTPKRKYLITTFALLALAALSYFLYPKPYATKSSGSIDKSIAVLPFIDLSEAKDQGWFSDGLTEEILNSLAQVKELKVISRTSSFAFKNKNMRIEIIADSLHVNYIVEGSVRKSGKGFRITAQLIRANDGFNLWSNTYNGNATDIFALQQEIATKIAQSLDISLDTKAMEEMQLAGTSNAEAYIAFLKGQELYNVAHEDRTNLLTGLNKANKFFEESSRLDPDFIKPYLIHADYYAHFLLDRIPSASDTLSEDVALLKLRFDLNAMVAKAKSESERNYYRLYQIMYSDDWTGMRPAIEKFLNDPDAARLLSYQSFALGTLLIYLGYDQEILRLSEKILINDPLNDAAQTDLIRALLFSEKYEEAIQRITGMGKPFNSSRNVNMARLIAFYKLNRTNEMSEILSMAALDSASNFFNDMKALVVKKNESSKNTLPGYSKNDISNIYYLFVIHEVYGREAANLRATYNDKKKILDFPLFNTILVEGKQLPYDLSDTPNLARKLKQAGPRMSETQ